jgi:hypothetical protein
MGEVKQRTSKQQLAKQDTQTVEGVLEWCGDSITREEAERRVREERKRRKDAAPDWTGAEFARKNERRHELIEKDVFGDGLTDDEREEFDRLQEQVGAWVDANTGIAHMMVFEVEEMDVFQDERG